MNRKLSESSTHRWNRFVLATLTAILLIGFAGIFQPTAAFAWQDKAEEKKPAAAAPAAPAKDAKPADDKKADGADNKTADTGAGTQENFLSWMIRASGIFGAILLLLSFVMVALTVMNILQVRRENMLPTSFIELFEQHLQAKDYQGAYDSARNDESFVARVLTAGLSKLNRGYEEAVEGMQEVGEDENMAMEHKLSYLALIGSIAPMIGLMGTVYGMILSFQKIATSTSTPKPSELADGISTALFTTLEGLTVAIPAMIAYSLLRNRMARYSLEVGMVSEGMMSRFSTMGKKPAGGGAPAAAPAAPEK